MQVSHSFNLPAFRLRELREKFFMARTRSIVFLLAIHLLCIIVSLLYYMCGENVMKNVDSNSERMVRVRFAPAPTGYLHIGGARTALFNWLFARHHKGTFVLRIEDTDVARSDEKMADDILAALRWLGLDWDEGPDADGGFGPYYQSRRGELYTTHIRTLLAEEKAYYCYCTDEELARRREEALKAGRPPMYENCCRELTKEQKAAFESEGRSPSVRFRVPDVDVTVNDLVRGETTFSKEVIGDFIIRRSDGRPSFHLANVVDDALMKISHVIRGEDHYSNTPRHLLLYKALGFDPPQFAHISMILAPDRSKLSKRHGAVALSDYRDRGYLSEALINYLALLGWSSPDEKELMKPAEIIDKFSLDRVAKSGAIFDTEKLNFINGQKMRTLPIEEMTSRAREFLGDCPTTQFDNFDKMLDLIRDNITTLADISERATLFTREPSYSISVITEPKKNENLALLKELVVVLEQSEGWDRNDQSEIFKSLSKRTGLKGRPLYHTIRIALTGVEEGPELVGVLDVLGREGTLERIKTALNTLA